MSDFRGGFGPAAYASMPAQIAAVTAKPGEGDIEKLIYSGETCDVK